MGNVLSRPGAAEDPWISIERSHGDAVATGLIIWGEIDFTPAFGHADLKNNHGGVNVFVRAEPEEEPVPTLTEWAYFRSSCSTPGSIQTP